MQGSLTLNSSESMIAMRAEYTRGSPLYARWTVFPVTNMSVVIKIVAVLIANYLLLYGYIVECY